MTVFVVVVENSTAIFKSEQKSGNHPHLPPLTHSPDLVWEHDIEVEGGFGDAGGDDSEADATAKRVEAERLEREGRLKAQERET